MLPAQRDAVTVKPGEIVGRKVQSWRDPLFPKSVEHLRSDVALERGSHHVKRRCGRAVHTEPRVVLRGEDDVTHTGQLRQSGPILRVEFAWVERLWQFREEPAHVILGRAHQGMADRRTELAVDTPVNKQAEPLIAKPLQAIGLIRVLRANRHDPRGSNSQDCGQDWSGELLESRHESLSLKAWGFGAQRRARPSHFGDSGAGGAEASSFASRWNSAIARAALAFWPSAA